MNNEPRRKEITGKKPKTKRNYCEYRYSLIFARQMLPGHYQGSGTEAFSLIQVCIYMIPQIAADYE